MKGVQQGKQNFCPHVNCSVRHNRRNITKAFLFVCVIVFLPSLIKAWGRFPVLIMWMMTTNRQEVESKHTLFVVLKGVEIAFRKTNGFSLSPLQTCGLMGSDASQILTLFQKENNFRFLQSM